MTRFTSEKVGYLAFLIFMNEREKKIKKRRKTRAIFLLDKELQKF